MSLMDMMSELDNQKDKKDSNLMDMFNKEQPARAPEAPKKSDYIPKKQSKAGRPTYKYANGRKMRQVTTSLCEDNVRWLVKFATDEGLTSGQIGYAINRLIEEKRGISEILMKAVDK